MGKYQRNRSGGSHPLDGAEYIGIPGLKHMTDEEYALLKEQDRKKYWRKPLEDCRPAGRKSWLYATHPADLAHCVTVLNAQKNLLRITWLGTLLKLNYPTLLRFLRDGRIKPVKNPVRYHPKRGHETVRTRRCYYDPLDVINAIQRRLNELGSEFANIEEGLGRYQLDCTPREMDERTLRVYQRRASLRERWTKEQLEYFINVYPVDEKLRQWLTPNAVAEWLEVTYQTLINWRRKFDETGDRTKYPPYHQGPDLVPSWARGDDGLQKPLSRRRRVDASFGRRFDPVLYDRNEIVQWLRAILKAKIDVYKED